MNLRENLFQYALLGFFGTLVLGFVAYIIFYEPPEEVSTSALNSGVVIWGPPVLEPAVTSALAYLKKEVDESYGKVTYVSKNPNTMYFDILEAGVGGSSPDIVVVDSTNLFPLKNLLIPIPFTSLPLSTYQNTWIDGSNIFISGDNIYAYPFFVDSLVMYWNRDLFINAAVAQVPEDWDTLKAIVPRLRKLEDGADLTQSAIAFGEYDNVLHAKEILSALILQTGNTIVAPVGEGYQSTLLFGNSNAHLALSFYTVFSNPANNLYSWNKTFDYSRDAFAANKVAMYAGFVSEQPVLEATNPNLNYGMSMWPQANNGNSGKKRTYGRFYGLGVLNRTVKSQDAFQVIGKLIEQDISLRMMSRVDMVSPRRDILTNFDPTDPNGDVIVRSAIMSHSWVEPAPLSVVDEAFSNAVNSIVSGNSTPGNGIRTINTDLSVLLKTK